MHASTYAINIMQQQIMYQEIYLYKWMCIYNVIKGGVESISIQIRDHYMLCTYTLFMLSEIFSEGDPIMISNAPKGLHDQMV